MLAPSQGLLLAGGAVTGLEVVNAAAVCSARCLHARTHPRAAQQRTREASNAHGLTAGHVALPRQPERLSPPHHARTCQRPALRPAASGPPAARQSAAACPGPWGTTLPSAGPRGPSGGGPWRQGAPAAGARVLGVQQRATAERVSAQLSACMCSCASWLASTTPVLVVAVLAVTGACCAHNGAACWPSRVRSREQRRCAPR
jgi:hypothetical protein